MRHFMSNNTIKIKSSTIKSSTIEATKHLLLQEQKGSFDKEKLIEDIISGKANLLTADTIALRLGIPIEVFHRWVKNGDSHYIIPGNLAMKMFGNALEDTMFSGKGNTTFPKPDVYIGNYPRWTVETFRNWLITNLK